MLKKIIQIFIKAYSYALSPFLGRNCRFHPSCSVYAAEAVEQHGAFKGIWLAIKRIGRCHPLYKGDYYDPVPKNVDCSICGDTEKSD